MADITYVPTWEGFLYLAIVLDVWSRRVVRWAMSPSLATPLVLAALEMATRLRQPTRVVHHSDKGCQYTSVAFGQRCIDAGIQPSEGRRAHRARPRGCLNHLPVAWRARPR